MAIRALIRSTKSRVARRVLGLFVLCALVPLSTLAFFTLRQISAEFNRVAVERLRQASKTSAMTITERLSALESDLTAIAYDLSHSGNTFEDVVLRYRNRVDARFQKLQLADERSFVMDANGKAHVLSGLMLVRTLRSTDGNMPVTVALQTPELRASRTLLLGEALPEYLWATDGLIVTSSDLEIVDRSGEVVFATADRASTAVPALLESGPRQENSGSFAWLDNNDPYLSAYWTLFLEPRYGVTWTFLHSDREANLLQAVYEFRWLFTLVFLLTFWVVLFLSVNQIRRTMGPLKSLKHAAEAMAAKKLGTRVSIRSGDEFEDLGHTFNGMAASIEKYVDEVQTMNQIGISLSAERNGRRLLDLVTSGVKQILNADGVALFLVDPSGKAALASLRVDSLNLAYDPEHVSRSSGFPFSDDTASAMLAIRPVADGQVMNVADVKLAGSEFDGFRQFDEHLRYRTRAFLGVPMLNHENELIGVLELFNPVDRTTGQPAHFSEQDQRVLESLASQAAVALSKNRLIDDFRNLFEALTQLIAKAIDEKSPYTGEHCKRVPVLAMMLADAVCASAQGPFAGFTFTEDELYELKIAALLHDCGKVTTPVHVVDKATKLQTIFDRVHLVNTRFEVVARDREIALLRDALRQSPQCESSELEIELAMADFRDQLRRDRECLQRANIGSEYMPPAHQDEVRQMAVRYRWRPFDSEEQDFLSAEELHNLTIPKGTLTPEEREIVNQHVVATMTLLADLPYPKNLRNVPTYAGAHHEHMDGSGYPLGLQRHQIAIQGRIIGVADVFEALTAKDRPYKKGKTVSETLRIMASMCRSGHLDRELFEVFVQERVYRPYAEKFLDPDQIDDVDESALLALSPQPAS